MPEPRICKDYKLSESVVDMIGQNADEKGGLIDTRVVESAVCDVDRRFFGPRSAEMAPIR